jgi:putative phosphoribosyl transferase
MGRIESIEIDRRRSKYGSSLCEEDVKGKVAIVVDDGIATGHTMGAAIAFVKKMKPGKVVVAVPVLPREFLKDFWGEADDVVYLEVPDNFRAIGAHYKKFPQLTDEEVVKILSNFRDGR